MVACDYVALIYLAQNRGKQDSQLVILAIHGYMGLHGTKQSSSDFMLCFMAL